MTIMQTNEVFIKRQEEIDALKNAIAKLDKGVSELKPYVTNYNEQMRERKDLRKTLAAKQREAKIVAEWFKGTTVIDERFPLFAQPKETESTE